MKRARLAAIALVSALWLAPGAGAQSTSLPPDVPTPYLPSTTVAVDEMLRIAAVGPGDLVADLGSGDGRVVITAARDYGARGLGIELDAKLVAESRANARAAGVEERVRFQQGDVLTADYRDATVVTLYLLPNLVEQLKSRLLELRPGTRIVAHDYGFKDWKPDRRIQISKSYLLYVVPAKVGGKWQIAATLPDGERSYDFELKQAYQELTGGASVPGGYLPAFEARLRGDRIAFVLVEGDTVHRFEGRVRGWEIEGVVRSGSGPKPAEGRWRATRVVGSAGEG